MFIINYFDIQYHIQNEINASNYTTSKIISQQTLNVIDS